MPDRILTSHAGSLPRPEDLIALNEQRATGDFSDEEQYLGRLRAAVADVVARQRDTGIDLVNDGEFGHSMGQRYDYGSWWTYVFQRLANIELTDAVDRGDTAAQGQARRDHARVASPSAATGRRSSTPTCDPTAGVGLPNRMTVAPVCRGPITYQGQADVQRDIADMKAAMAAAGVADGFLNSVAPGSCARFGNEYYADDEEMMYACADAMREEYTAIIDAGPGPAARRPGDRGELGPDQPGAEHRGLPAVHPQADRGAELRHPGPAGRADPVPPVLGQLARARTSPTSRWPTSSTSCWRSTRAPTRSRPPTCGTSTSGRSGGT